MGTINDAIARMENVALSHAIRAEGARKAFANVTKHTCAKTILLCS